MRPLDRARCWALLLLLALLSDAAGGRRGAGGRSAGAGGLRGGFRAVSRGGGAPGRGSKVAGAIAAGAAAGYGMGLLGRPRPSRLGHGVPAARQPQPAGGFHAGGWPDLGGKRGPPSAAPGERRAGPGLALLLAWGACLVSHGLQR
ncbi:spidroin-1-like [Prinia subflava]|uniref:spidroin-1-like n=1 Tax=Prinia subflava TaxID=208062 RepID=UPI002FE1F0E5